MIFRSLEEGSLAMNLSALYSPGFRLSWSVLDLLPVFSWSPPGLLLVCFWSARLHLVRACHDGLGLRYVPS
jgi:hypothetical protein